MVMDKTASKKGFNKNILRNRNIIRLLMLLLILAGVNFISSFVFTRFDLTSDKRFTLSPVTKNLVGNLKDIVYVKVYLDGDFPPAFKRLQNATREMLDELRAYSHGNIEYEFINPAANPDEKERNKLYQQLVSRGVQPTSLQAQNKAETSQQIIFPGAIISYLGEELPLMLLQDQIGTSPEQMLNNSIQGLEYGFGNVIRKLSVKVPYRIAFIEGQGESDEMHVADITRELQSFYIVDRVRIEEKLDRLQGYRTIVIAGPDSVFSEKDKFIIDQFIMKGGKVLWLVDGAKVSMDSLQTNDETIAISNETGLGDMLFRYGARINYDLVLDIQAAPIPVVTGVVGNRPRQTLLPWYYFPVSIPDSKHPIVNNLNAVKFDFVSSIDAVGSQDVQKIPLLTSSKYSRIFTTPARVNLNIMREEPDLNQYNNPGKTLAMLLEGTFTSNFKNRIPQQIAGDSSIGFRNQSDANRMIVVGDGDVIRNGLRKSTGGIIPLGMDRYTNEIYGNKNFLLNCIDYLSDDSGLMTVRSKELKLRLLDKTKLTSSVLFWQVVNTSGPLLVIALFGFAKFYSRKRKYAR